MALESTLGMSCKIFGHEGTVNLFQFICKYDLPEKGNLDEERVGTSRVGHSQEQILWNKKNYLHMKHINKCENIIAIVK